MTMPIEAPKIFISHSWDNKPLVRRLEEELKAAGAEVWVDHSGVGAGDNLPEHISEALEACNVLLLIWSAAAATSHWVKLEWTNALALRKLIIPCRLDETALPPILTNVLHIDFRHAELGLAELKRVVQHAQQPTGMPLNDQTEKLAHVLRGAFARGLPAIWNVPHHRNPNFTGRENLLHDLRVALTSEKAAALTQTIHGLGGVGKTQLALEYAYRHAADYDLVWWLRAEDAATLATDFAQLATTLALPERDAQEQNLIIAAVRRWLDHHAGWLLMFDNAQKMEDLRPYLPQSPAGHVVITSRNPNWRGMAGTLKVVVMEPQEAVAFLCRRTGQSDTATAQALAEALGYLPLALEQAGAYIEAADKSLTDYLQLFQRHQQTLLARGKPSTEYPHTVATTWELSFQQVQEHSPAGVELLHLCAFLAPEAMPTELLREGMRKSAENHALALSDPLVFDEALITLRSFSLLEMQSDSLAMHRLVQAVARDRLTEMEQKTWTEMAAQIVVSIFPTESWDFRFWSECAVLLPHARMVVEHAEELQIAWEAAADLLNRIGSYLRWRAAYAEAELLLHRALVIGEKQLGPEHLIVASSLNRLAVSFYIQGQYAQAEPLWRRALAIREKQLGPEHPEVATILNNLALSSYYLHGQYTQVESLLRRALAIREKQLGLEHPHVAKSLNNLARLLKEQGRCAEAEPLIRRALAIREKQLGPEHPDVADSLNSLAELLRAQGHYAEAEPLVRRALAIREKQLGSEHPDVAESLNSLAELFGAQGQCTEAEPLVRRALAIREKQLGREHPEVARSLNSLAEVLRAQGHYAEAEPLVRRALAIREKQLGPEHPEVAQSLNSLAEVLRAQGHYAEAEPLNRRAIAILEKTLGPEHPHTKKVRKNLEILLSERSRK